MQARAARIEWPTVALIVVCTLSWLTATYLAGHFGWWPLLAVAVLSTTLHSSLQHEVLHGHPTRDRTVNETLVFLPIGVFFPFRRFKSLHLQHHNDPNLTDPYEDPETNYMAKADWDKLPAPVQRLRDFNNTLIGRLIVGPAIAVFGFWLHDARLLAAGDRQVQIAWVLHAAGLAVVLWWVMAVCGLGFWAYVLLVAYPAFSLLSVRTFIEHRAEQLTPFRTCIVEDRSGFWSLLFLNNNLHVVHHELPTAPWYRLPSIYRAQKQRYLGLNGGFTFPGYWAIFRRYAFASKAPIPHPFLPRDER